MSGSILDNCTVEASSPGSTGNNNPLALPCAQVGRLFATVERGSPSKLALTTDVPAGFDQALYFVRDVEQLCLPENIQVEFPSDQ